MAKKPVPAQKPSEEDIAINTLFQEVDDDLRQDKATKLWKRFGTPLISVIVLAIVAVGAFEGWSAYDRQNREVLGEKFDSALTLANDGKTADANALFDELSAEKSGYATLAVMQKAANLAKAGDAKAAADAYLAIANQTDLDPTQKNLARLLGGLNALNGGDAARALSVLETIKDSASPLRHSAAELTAYALAEQGDKAKAREIMAQLSEDASVPAGLRARAREFSQVYAAQ